MLQRMACSSLREMWLGQLLFFILSLSVLVSSTRFIPNDDADPNAVLKQAIEANNLALVHECLNNGADPNYQLGNIPLLELMLQKREYNLVLFLLERGARLNNLSKTWIHPLYSTSKQMIADSIYTLLLLNGATFYQDYKLLFYLPPKLLRTAKIHLFSELDSEKFIASFKNAIMCHIGFDYFQSRSGFDHLIFDVIALFELVERRGYDPNKHEYWKGIIQDAMSFLSEGPLHSKFYIERVSLLGLLFSPLNINRRQLALECLEKAFAIVTGSSKDDCDKTMDLPLLILNRLNGHVKNGIFMTEYVYKNLLDFFGVNQSIHLREENGPGHSLLSSACTCGDHSLVKALLGLEIIENVTNFSDSADIFHTIASDLLITELFLKKYSSTSGHAEFYKKLLWKSVSIHQKRFEVFFLKLKTCIDEQDYIEIVSSNYTVDPQATFILISKSKSFRVDGDKVVFLLEGIINDVTKYMLENRTAAYIENLDVVWLDYATRIFEELLSYLTESQVNQLFATNIFVFAPLFRLTRLRTLTNIDDVLVASVDAGWASFAKLLIVKLGAKLPKCNLVKFKQWFCNWQMHPLVQLFYSNQEVYQSFDDEIQQIISNEAKVHYYALENIENTHRLLTCQTPQRLAQELFETANKIGCSFAPFISAFNVYMFKRLEGLNATCKSFDKPIRISDLYPGIAIETPNNFSKIAKVLVELFVYGKYEGIHMTAQKFLSILSSYSKEIQYEYLVRHPVTFIAVLGSELQQLSQSVDLMELEKESPTEPIQSGSEQTQLNEA